MVDPKFPPFVIRSLASQNSNPKIPDEFFTTHLQGNNELTKLKLTSAASDKTWKVKLNGRTLADGWEDFSAAHCLRDDDVLVFRHVDDMVFHVTPSGRSFSRFNCISSSSDGSEDNDDSDEDDGDEEDSEDDDDDEEDSEDDDDDDDSEDDGDDSDSKKKSRSKTESFSSEKFCLLAATPSNLRLNRLALSKPFTRANDLNNRCCEMDLMNLTGKKSWTAGLRYNPIAGQVLIQGGWKRFCRANKLKTRSLYRFKLVNNGTRPVLQLCSKSNEKVKQNKFLKVTFKPYMLHSRQIRLPVHFMKVNGIKEGEMTLVDKNGVEWPSYAAVRCRGFYMNKNFRRFCEANGIETGDTFTLEFVRGEGTTPILKFYSKTKAEIGQALCDDSDEEEEAQEETETPVRKKARVFTQGGPSHCPRSSNISNADPRRLRRKEQLQPCSISEHLAKVKQITVDTLIGVRGLQSELKMKEQKIKMSLQDIDALGEKVMEIKQFFQ